MASDVLIVGGGPVGGALALALADAGILVTVVDHQRSADILSDTSDIRGYAIAASSKRFLDTIGLWSHIAKDASPINDICITDGVDPVALSFTLEHDEGEGVSLRPEAEPMGYIVEAFRLRQAVVKLGMDHPNIDWIDGGRVDALGASDGESLRSVTLAHGRTLSVPLVVGADGRGSFVRQTVGISVATYDYAQTALVCTVQHDNPHRGLAYEKFYQGGPFATLPMTHNRSAIVWSERPEVAHLLQTMPEQEFLSLLQERMGEVYQGVSLVSKRYAYPLQLQLANAYTATRCALVGDAAHVIHPLAGQGMNLGLRDSAVLAACLIKRYKLGLDLGDETALSTYEQWRRVDQLSLVAVTHGLSRLFTNESMLLKKLRPLGMRLFNKCTPLKRLAAKHAMGDLGDRPGFM